MVTVVMAALVALAPIVQELVLVREGDKQYHRPGCAVVRDGEGVLAMSRGQAESRELKPHPDCDPANPRNTSPGQAPAPAVHVYLDKSAFYHREKCAKLGAEPKRVTLDEAAKKHWPCRVCKPPIRARKPPR